MDPSWRPKRTAVRGAPNPATLPAIPTPKLTPLAGMTSDDTLELSNTGTGSAVVVVSFLDEVTGRLALNHVTPPIKPKAKLTLRPRDLRALPKGRRHRIAVWATQPVAVTRV